MILLRNKLNNNLKIIKRYCHHHSQTFKKETIKLLKINEEQTIKKEIDYLKIKTSDHQHKINLLKEENEYLQMEVQNLKFTGTMSQIYIFTISITVLLHGLT